MFTSLRRRGRPAGLRLRLRSVRARTTLAATAVVALVLGIACAALVVLQDHQLVAGSTALADQQVAVVVAQLRSGKAPDVAAAAPGVGRGEHSLVQVVSAGAVLAANVGADEDQAAGGTVVSRVSGPQGAQRSTVDGEPFVVVHRDVTAPDGTVVTVLVAESLETVERATRVATALLSVGCPLVLLAVANTSWWLTGRALRPVEGIRRRVDTVSATDLSARVPVPASGDEIAHLATTMNTMLARLQAASEAQRRFVADASHELRSPLATVRAVAELSRDHPAALPWAEAADTVLSETGRLDALVGDLLLLARADEDGPVARREDVDLDDVVGAEVARLRRLGRRSVLADVAPVRVSGDARHLARAVRNLVDNAEHHAVSAVRVRLSTRGGVARLEVADDGQGIPADQRERVFERFVRLDDSRERARGGTGLGLAITRQIAREHGGEVVVAASEGGALMLLTVPTEASTGPAPRPELGSTPASRQVPAKATVKA